MHFNRCRSNITLLSIKYKSWPEAPRWLFMLIKSPKPQVQSVVPSRSCLDPSMPLGFLWPQLPPLYIHPHLWGRAFHIVYLSEHTKILKMITEIYFLLQNFSLKASLQNWETLNFIVIIFFCASSQGFGSTGSNLLKVTCLLDSWRPRQDIYQRSRLELFRTTIWMSPRC